MSDVYLDILKEWERTVADPVIYNNLDVLLPAFQFRRVLGAKEHWASRYKADLSLPRHRNAEKTVVYPGDMHIREQGEYHLGEWVLFRLQKEMGVDSPYEVYREISSRFHLDMPMPNSADVAKAIRHHARKSEVLDALKEYFIWNFNYNSQSAKATKVRSYLTKKRGFSDEAIDAIGFGFVPSWDTVETYMTRKLHISKEDLDAACSVRNADGKTAVGRTHTLAIPYVCGEELKGFIFRRVDSDDAPKYLANRDLDRKSVFFNIPRKTEDIIVVEGEMDALSTTAAGVPSVVAMGGSDISGDRRKQVEDALRRGVTRIFLCPDLDTVETESGESVPNYKKRYNAVMRSVHTIRDVSFDFEKIYVVRLPYPTDPDSFIRKEGMDAFVALLKESLPYWKYDSWYHENCSSGE